MEEYGNQNSFISLIFLDISRHSLQKLHTIEYPAIVIQIIINKADPTTFILNYRNNGRWSKRIFKIVEETIIVGEIVEIQIEMNPIFFHDKCVYSLKRIHGNGEYRINVRILYV
jgi:hypothetical protein